MKAYLFILAALASYRITRFLTTDTFPLVAKPRAYLLRRFGASSWVDVISCDYCLGSWVSLGNITLLKYLSLISLSWGVMFLLWPALAGAQALLNALDRRLQ